ncbi:hypothetical protein [Selenomonas ruminantium]|uniref:hypothetical protein n=1 Tax=Selenomonas ruminantium TaxID=971 RepID=UPI00047A7304|nr:hypothetical protein [Selenomonas ruminantium]
MGKLLEQLSFWSGVSVITSTIICIVLFEWYRRKNPPLDGVPSESLSAPWLIGFFSISLFLQVRVARYMDVEDAITSIIGDVIGNSIAFFVIYGILGVLGVCKDNKDKRLVRAFQVFVVITFALCFLVYD